MHGNRERVRAKSAFRTFLLIIYNEDRSSILSAARIPRRDEVSDFITWLDRILKIDLSDFLERILPKEKRLFNYL